MQEIINLSKVYWQTLSIDCGEPLPDPGFIYVLEAFEGVYKIGRTAEFSRRVKQLQVLLPFPATIAYAFFTIEHVYVEERLHDQFASQRLNGEWFHLDPIDDLGIIQEWASFRGFYETKDGILRLDPFFPFQSIESGTASLCQKSPEVDL
jgi:hypothetical protein